MLLSPLRAKSRQMHRSKKPRIPAMPRQSSAPQTAPRRSGRRPRTGHLVLQHKRADRRTASPVIAALCQVGGQNANRQSEHERGGDDYALGHHESPLGLLGHPAPIAVYSTAACDARHRFGEYIVEHAEHVSIVIAKNYSRRRSLARLVPWIVSERSFSRPLKPRRVRGFL